jgi:hypothetical protein
MKFLKKSEEGIEIYMHNMEMTPSWLFPHVE